MNNIIEQYYEAYNFPSANKLYNLLRDDNHDVKKKDIEDYLNKKEEVQIFKEAKKSKKRLGHITSLQPNFSWQIDISYLMKYYKANKGFKYILACIDIFTRKLYCIPMKNKDNDEVKLALNCYLKKQEYIQISLRLIMMQHYYQMNASKYLINIILFMMLSQKMITPHWVL